jgi:3-dehydroquinate synthase
MPAGEENKNIETATCLWQKLSEKNVDKTAVLLCLGGGVVCDMGGFVGATFKRGMDYVFIPTSLTAQIDASIGGKTAVNLNGIKNQIGVFHQPKTVFTIPAFLETLPEREIFSGFVEMLKHGLIADKTYWEELIKIRHAPQMIQSELIKKSIGIKTAICHADPYEMGERKKLNFGHSIGHALESFALCAGHALSHGEAVAWGMMAESSISCQKKGISEAELAVITEVLSRFVQPFPIEKKDYAILFSYLQKDKKKVNNNLNFTLLNAIGSAVINQNVRREEVEKVMKKIVSLQFELQNNI